MHTAQQISFANIHFFVGLDAQFAELESHHRLDGLELKLSLWNPSPLELIAYLQETLSDGILSYRLRSRLLRFWALTYLSAAQHRLHHCQTSRCPYPTNKEKVNKSDPYFRFTQTCPVNSENKSLRTASISPIPSTKNSGLFMAASLPYYSISNPNQKQNQKGFLLSRNTKFLCSSPATLDGSLNFILCASTTADENFCRQFYAPVFDLQLKRNP